MGNLKDKIKEKEKERFTVFIQNPKEFWNQLGKDINKIGLAGYPEEPAIVKMRAFASINVLMKQLKGDVPKHFLPISDGKGEFDLEKL